MNSRFFLTVFAVMILGNPVFAQGILLPDSVETIHRWHLPRPIRQPAPLPPSSYKIKEIAIHTRIQDQVARTQVTQSFVNTGSRQLEVCFIFPLPYDGAVDRLTFMVDGKEYDAQLLTKEKAREVYEGYLRRNKDPALLEWMGTGLFKTSVFPIPPGAERSVTLRYTQLLRKNQQLTDYLFPLSTAKYTSDPVETLSVNVSVESTADIKSVYSPTHDVQVERPDARHAVLRYEGKNLIPATDFRLFYDTAATALAASVLSYWPANEDNGYFLLLASPDISATTKPVQRKTTILVLDRSGSMSGKKIEQAKEALKFVINNLNEGDLFNIIAYDSEIESFRPELQRFDEKTRQQAVGFVNGIFAGGSTNIDGALSTALAMIQDAAQVNYVVFLTDGRPTAGTQIEAEIVQNAKNNNRHAARLICFGVGYDVNSRLIDRLSRANRGQSEYVRPDEDLESHVSRLFRNMTVPVMVDVTTTFDVEGSAILGSPVNRVYPQQIYDIFAGQQITMAGRYRSSGAAKISFVGQVNGETQTFAFPAQLASQNLGESYAFVEKIWASRRIGEIIDQLDLQGRNAELIDELVELSTKHGILTPYTSFLADDQARPQELADRRRNADLAFRNALGLEQAEGRDGFGQRLSKKAFQEAQRLPAADSRQLAEQLSTRAATPSANARSGLEIAGGVAVPALDGTVRVTDAVIHANENAIYRRGKLLIAANASDLDLEKDQTAITEVDRFSEAYFALIQHTTTSENGVLARQQDDEQLLVRLGGIAYLIK